MYTQRKWQIAARNRRLKAFLYAFAFHLVLLAGIVYSAEKSLQELIPDFAKEWFYESKDDLKGKKDNSPKA